MCVSVTGRSNNSQTSHDCTEPSPAPSPILLLLLGNYHLGYTLYMRLYPCKPSHFGCYDNPGLRNGLVPPSACVRVLAVGAHTWDCVCLPSLWAFFLFIYFPPVVITSRGCSRKDTDDWQSCRERRNLQSCNHATF